MAGIFTSTSPLYKEYLDRYNQETAKGNIIVKLTPQQFLGYYGSETRALNKILTEGNFLQKFTMQTVIKSHSKQAVLINNVLFASSYDKYWLMSQETKGAGIQAAVSKLLQNSQLTQSKIDGLGIQNIVDQVQKDLTNPDAIKRHLEILSPDEWLEYRKRGLSNKQIIENEYDIPNALISGIVKAIKEIVNTKGQLVYENIYDISNLESHIAKLLRDPKITSLDDLIRQPETFLIYVKRLNRGIIKTLTRDQFRGLIGLLKNLGLSSATIDEILSPGAN